MGVQSQLKLTWNNHNAIIKSNLHSLWQKGNFCDVTLACNGNYFPVHKFIMSACSTYFQEILEMTPCRHPFIIIKDVQEDDLRSLLEFMYNGELTVPQNKVSSIIKAAETFKIIGLGISEQVAEDNCNGKPNKIFKKDESIFKKGKLRKLGKKRKQSVQLLKSSSEKKLKLIEKVDHSVESTTVDNKNNDNLATEIKNKEHISIEMPIEKDIIPTADSIAQVNETLLSHQYNNENKIKELFKTDIKIEDEEWGIDDPVFLNNLTTSNVSESTKESLENSLKLTLEHSSMNSKSQETLSPEKLASSLECEKNTLELLYPQEIEGFTISEWSDRSSPEPVDEKDDPDWNCKLQKSYQCELCSYKTKFRCNLHKHLKTHTGEKPYKCKYCLYSTTQSCNIKMHARIHTGEKPYQCSICTYSSIQRSNLKKHMRVHSGEKPFICQFCPYRAAQKTSLKKHVNKSHIEIK